MARTNKWNEKNSENEPRWFTHNGPFNSDPKKIKREGAGKNNWGRMGDELLDDEDVGSKSSGRRNSNHSHNEQEMKELNSEVNKVFFSSST